VRPLLALAVLGLVAAPLAGCIGQSNSGVPAPIDQDPDAAQGPAWSLRDTMGVTHARETTAGDAVVLFFMATWCGSCRSKAPVLASIERDYAERGVRLFSVGYDPLETDGDLEAWKARHGQPWPHGIDHGQKLQRTFGVTSQSSVVLLDGDGKVVERWGYGQVTEDALRRALDRLARA